MENMRNQNPNENQKDWLTENAKEEQWQMAPVTEAEVRNRRMDANGFNADTDEILYMSGGDEDEDREESEEDEDADTDWGQVDPLENGFPDSNDPSGPGSAV